MNFLKMFFNLTLNIKQNMKKIKVMFKNQTKLMNYNEILVKLWNSLLKIQNNKSTENVQYLNGMNNELEIVNKIKDPKISIVNNRYLRNVNNIKNSTVARILGVSGPSHIYTVNH